MRELVIALLVLLVSGSSSQGCTTGELRLFDNGDTNSNRELVQVCYDGSWSTLCGRNGWSTHSANIVCRQLGYLEYGANWGRSYGQTMFTGTANFVLLESSCQGDETVLTNCTLRMEATCYKYGLYSGFYYAAVTCKLANCNENEIRLVGGSTPWEGRVEVCSDGRWGTVCGEGWTERDASHVCSKLGYSREGGEDPGTEYDFGEGTGPIHNLTCQQTDCEQVILTTSCSHSQDVGVRCESYNEACAADSCDETTEANGGITNALNSSTNDSLLGALLGLLGVTLAVVLTGWIVTCVYLQRKINRQVKDHAHPVYPSDPAPQLNNPVYDIGNLIPPPTTYSSLGPSYETVNTDQGVGHSYDIINRTRPPTTHPDQEHDYSVLESNGHTTGEGGGVVEGVYSLVEESDPQNYEITTPTTERQEYSKLQH